MTDLQFLVKDPDLFLVSDYQAVDDAFVPADPDLMASMQVGDCVRVVVGKPEEGSEAFWVALDHIGPHHLIGTVVNDLLHTEHHQLRTGDAIRLTRDNVFAVSLFR